MADMWALEGLEEERGLDEKETLRKAAVTNDLERITLLE
jgi:hypothetical protein